MKPYSNARTKEKEKKKKGRKTTKKRICAVFVPMARVLTKERFARKQMLVYTSHPLLDTSSTQSAAKSLVHRLVRKLNAKEGSRVGRNRTSNRGPKPREEGADTAPGIQLADDAPDGDGPLRGLETRLDGINGENGRPHGHTGGRAGSRDGEEAQLALRLAGDGVARGEAALDVLVGGEVGGGAGAVAGEGGGGAAEDGADAALAVELADDVGGSGVAGLLARLEVLGLHLQDDLDALKGGGDGSHGDGGEEAGGGGLADGEGGVGVFVGREGADDGFAEVVAPEGDGDCGFC